MSVRQEKVQAQLVQELSDMIQRQLKDPRLGFVTVTDAEISRDLRHAKVYVSVLGDEEARKQSLNALNSAVGLLRGEFARRAHLRVAPEIEFRFDEGIERGQRIFELLHSIEGDLQPHGEDGVTSLPAGAPGTSPAEGREGHEKTD
ncbi:MAG TPA: 30S ribosome-binding factor RbfA [Chthonomonadaceae bacterium]|nr:30S ribosome-binding factor RbfA [Chthonomonadaceae bacterium]